MSLGVAGNSRPGIPSLLRRHNTALVLTALRSRASLTRAELSRTAGLSKPTINEVVSDLLRVGYLRELPTRINETPRGGRPGRPLAIRFEAGYLVGIDIGAQKIQAVVADLSGEFLASERRPIPSDAWPTAAVVLSEVREAVSSVLSRASVEPSNLKAIAVGTPGQVDPVCG